VFTTALVQPDAIQTPAFPLDLFEAIAALKQELNAVILAHYYQEPDIQDIADYIGDSLGLSRQAASTDADTIVFAGVHFMAETAKILNPDLLVLLPDLNAGCSLADSCPPDAFAAFKAAHPQHVVVSYINCSAAIKAMSDIICTSSNAVKIVSQIPEDRPIIFAPDRNLGRYVMEQTGREMLLWEGSCMVHETFSEKKIVQLQIAHPEAEIVAHPECEPSVLRHASYVGSTTALLKYASSIALLNKVRYSESLALTGFHRWMLYLIISRNAIVLAKHLLWQRSPESFTRWKNRPLVSSLFPHRQGTTVLVTNVLTCG